MQNYKKATEYRIPTQFMLNDPVPEARCSILAHQYISKLAH